MWVVELAHREVISFGKGGWVRYESDTLRAPVFLRFDDHGGRLRAIEIFVADDDGLTTDLFHRLPLGRIEATVNDPDDVEGMRARLRLAGPDLRRAISYWSTSFGSHAPHTWVLDMFKAQHGDAPQPEQRPLSGGDVGRKFEFAVDLDLGPIEAGKRDRGDAFYRRVAEAYSDLAGLTACRPNR